MIKLSLKKEYGIFKPFEFELPDFTIITGLNGAGKSQLLEVIDKQITPTDGKNIISYKFLYQSNKIEPSSYSDTADGDSIRKKIKELYDDYLRNKQQAENEGKNLDEILRTIPNGFLIRDIIHKAGKPIKEKLNFNDFIQHVSLDVVDMGHEYKSHNFAVLFRLYVYKIEHNKYMKFLHKEKGQRTAKYYSDKEFKKNFGEPPWEFVNQVLEAANLDYRVNSPSLDMDSEERFDLKFTDKKTGAEVNFNGLSSGEKVIMSLALAQYNSKKEYINFLNLMLMDEPDASLHPSMTKQFLNVMENVFVRDKGVKVIMTTHSPSTVALAKEESLFVMDKTTRIPVKTTKDRALRILTTGVPSLSINYENRKQVFVESEHDVSVYEKIYDKLKNTLISEISLDFIASGNGGSGSCGQVKEIVNKLNEFGNKAVYGVIDWDGENIGNAKVKVLGKNNRHSLENYLFDPILLAAFLLREKIITREQLKLSNNENHTDFKDFNDFKLQTLADFVIASVLQGPVNGDLAQTQTVQYCNGRVINIPKWYLLKQGHALEEQIKSKYSELKKYQKNDALKKAIITTVIDEVPDLIPNDFKDLFTSIQDYDEV